MQPVWCIEGKNMYGKKSIGIERSTFLCSETGVIVKIFRKVKVDGHVEEIVKALHTM